MKILRVITVAVLWLTLAYVNAGFFLADFMYAVPDQDYRQQTAFFIGWSLFPLAWILCPFMTGFYQHGWMRPALHDPRSQDGSTGVRP